MKICQHMRVVTGPQHSLLFCLIILDHCSIFLWEKLTAHWLFIWQAVLSLQIILCLKGLHAPSSPQDPVMQMTTHTQRLQQKWSKWRVVSLWYFLMWDLRTSKVQSLGKQYKTTGKENDYWSFDTKKPPTLSVGEIFEVLRIRYIEYFASLNAKNVLQFMKADMKQKLCVLVLWFPMLKVKGESEGSKSELKWYILLMTTSRIKIHCLTDNF